MLPNFKSEYNVSYRAGKSKPGACKERTDMVKSKTVSQCVRRKEKEEAVMKHKRSLEALIVGFVLTIAVSFFSTKIAGAVLAVSLIQMFLFYRCPHCGYGLYNVCGMMPSCCPNCGEDL